MDLRATINEYPRLTTAMIAAAILVATLFFVLNARSSGSHLKPAELAYFSDDDGKTFFTDDARKVAPFDHGGRLAVAAYVYQSADGKKFVGYLERAANPKAQESVARNRRLLIERAVADPMGTPDGELLTEINRNLEIKRPGETRWVSASDPRARGQAILGPDGSVPVPVAP